MTDERSLEGWAPTIGAGITLEEVVDLAFDYRGDVTLRLADGGTLIGYLYNRNRAAAKPFVQVFDPTGTSHTIPYARIRAIAFTGKDTAAGKSYEAWLRRKAETDSASRA